MYHVDTRDAYFHHKWSGDQPQDPLNNLEDVLNSVDSVFDADALDTDDILGVVSC